MYVRPSVCVSDLGSRETCHLPLFEELLRLPALDFASFEIALHTRKLFHIIGTLLTGDRPYSFTVLDIVIIRRATKVNFGVGLINSTTSQQMALLVRRRVQQQSRRGPSILCNNNNMSALTICSRMN